MTQPWPRWRVRLRAAGAVVGVAATVGAVAGERWTAVSRAITDSFARLNTGSFGLIAVVAVTAAGTAALLVRRMLPHFPAGVVRAGSARAGTVLLAAAFLNVPLLTWIAEDSHWRGRRLHSRPWPRLAAFSPRLGPAFVLAWADWRRLGRRPAVLAALAVGALAPALAGAAFTGRAHGWVTAAVLLAGAIAAGTQGTAATRRDTNDPALRRLLGVDAEAALVARAVLPALLGAAWLTLALALLALTGELPGALWPVLGLAAGPGVAAAALRIARTAPINPADQGPDAPVTAPPWLLTRAGSLLLGLVAAWPTLRAVYAGHVHASTFGAQVVVDLANAPSWDDKAVLEFFETSGRNLLAAEAAAGVRHHVALSIVGTDRTPDNGYFRAKLAQEKLIETSTIPYTIIRSTQFMEFLKGIADSSTNGNIVRLSPGLFQPIAADDVAAIVADVALAAPRNGIVEIAGPERAPFNEIVARYLKALSDPREVVRDPEARYFGGRVEERSLVPLGEARLGRIGLDEWLRRSVAQR